MTHVKSIVVGAVICGFAFVAFAVFAAFPVILAALLITAFFWFIGSFFRDIFWPQPCLGATGTGRCECDYPVHHEGHLG